jgi:hypothetical protein
MSKAEQFSAINRPVSEIAKPDDGCYPIFRFALWFSVAGLILMALCFAWNIGPEQTNHIPQFVKDYGGEELSFLIFFACLSAMLITRGFLPPHCHSGPLLYIVLFTFQAVIYFILGLLVAACFRKISQKWTQRHNKPKKSSF